MPEPPSAADEQQLDQLDRVRELLGTATARLLGATIEVGDEDWRRPSRLPGWSRGHVATHLARQADALVRVADGARRGVLAPMYDSLEQREQEIEDGAHRPGLELQVDLDTSAQRLEQAFAALTEEDGWDAPVELRGGLRGPARLLPLARLLEVVLHHVDLDLGQAVEDVDATTADWLLEWCALRLRQRDDFPRLELVSSTTRLTVGSVGPARTVRGSSPQLLGWLTGRAVAAPPGGAENLHLPTF